MKLLSFSETECIISEEGKTFAIDSSGKKFRIKMRLYEIEEVLPSYFIRINKSALANEKLLERFSVGFSGAVDAVFKSGYKEYVSRRCFADIKRRYNAK
jgi:DNA-binding LytR/AlgR family response regulator